MSRTKEMSDKTVPMAGLKLDFSESPVIYDFIQSKNFVQGIMGPVGSGKSYGCAAKIFIKAVQQKASPIDNVRYSALGDCQEQLPHAQDHHHQDMAGPVPRRHVWAHAVDTAHHPPHPAACP
jgi:pantothenate kinase-related protein Tda10